MELKHANDLPYIDFNQDELKFIKRAVYVLASNANRLQSSLARVTPVDYNLERVSSIVSDISNMINSSLLFAELMTEAQYILLTYVNHSKL